MGTQQAAPDDFQGEPVEVSGLLDLRDEGYGFLRVKAYLPSKEDVYVSVKQVRQFGLRKGDVLTGAARPASRNEKNPALLRIDEVNGKEPELNKQRARFEDLTPAGPVERLRLELPPEDAGDAGDEGEGAGTPTLTGAAREDAARTIRVIDLVTPVGKGQRGLVVAPAGTGRTTLLKQLGMAIEAADPDVQVIALLIDARPEEVTDLGRSLRGTVIASPVDRPAEEHTMVSELVVERAKRLVEEGRDVVLLLDGLSRLARAYQLVAPASGRVLAEGVDAAAVQPVKRILAAARRIEEAGSLTMLATAQVDTGSRFDEVIVEELRRAANLELHLDRSLAERRIFPAVDVVASATRQDEELLGDGVEGAVRRLRREWADAAEAGGARAAIEALHGRLEATATTEDLLGELAGG